MILSMPFVVVVVVVAAFRSGAVGIEVVIHGSHIQCRSDGERHNTHLIRFSNDRIITV